MEFVAQVSQDSAHDHRIPPAPGNKNAPGGRAEGPLAPLSRSPQVTSKSRGKQRAFLRCWCLSPRARGRGLNLTVLAIPSQCLFMEHHASRAD